MFCYVRRSNDRNPDAADDQLRREMMRKGPFCRDANHKILTCSANATRTKRAGRRELQYEVRDDRQYWYQRGHSNTPTNRDSPSATARRPARLLRAGAPFDIGR